MGSSLFLLVSNPFPQHRHLFFRAALTTFFFAASVLFSEAYSSSDFSALLHETSPLTQKVTTDQEALALFSSRFMKNQSETSASQAGHSRRIQRTELPDEVAPLGIVLIREIATMQWASQLQGLLKEHPLSSAGSTVKDQEHLLDWITKNSTQPDLRRVLSLKKTWVALTAYPQPATKTSDDYVNFTLHMLESYPDWTNSESAWLNIAEQKGPSAIVQRLESYWKTDISKNAVPPTRESGYREALIGRFIRHHVLPIVTAHLKLSLVGLQSESERRAWQALQQVQSWKTQRDQRQGLTRLCGTWQWLIHNHQNHGDHKTVMVYPPPSQYDRMVPKPDTIQVRGDTLYIRWEFPNGIIQEESLLFSEKDRMLSGTFVNNMGPNGNITARRIAPCQNP